jgi:hypothetical protein
VLKVRKYTFFGSILAFAILTALVWVEPRAVGAVQGEAAGSPDSARVARDPRVPPRRRRRLFKWLGANRYKE